MRLFPFFLALAGLGFTVAAGCSASDPCKDAGGTCIALTVASSNATQVDQFHVQLTGGANTSYFLPDVPKLVSLPQTIALRIPDGATGDVNLDVIALLAGEAIGRGSTKVTLKTGGAVAVTVDVSAVSPVDGGTDGPGSDASTPMLCPKLSGLAFHFPFDSNVADLVGNPSSAVGTVTFAPGKIGGAAHFDGTTSAVRNAGTMSLAGARTICAWLRPATHAGLGQPIVSGGAAGAADLFALQANLASTNSACAAGANSPYLDHAGAACVATSTPATTLMWSFFCWASDGAGMVSLTVDGNTSTKAGAAFDYGFDTLTIGYNGLGGTTTSSFYSGDMDELTIWTRALSSSEVGMLYAGGAGCQAQ